MKSLYRFVIEDTFVKDAALGDSLTITEAGAVKLWAKGKLVGIVKPGSWTRVYVDASQPVTITGAPRSS
jgi:hypothetical protein